MFIAVEVYGSDDSIWSNRNTEDGAKASYEYYKQQFNNEKNYENAWKFSRAAHFYADNFIKLEDQKKKVFTEGKEAAENATNMEPDKPEGHYFLGISLGSWAEANGVLDSLFRVPAILREAKKVIEIEPAFDNGSAYMLLARVYHKAPAIISVGDKDKAQKNYEKAIEYGPGNRVAFRFYAEFLMDFDKKKAKEITSKGLEIPLDESNKYREEKEIQLLKELQTKL
jgi:tetratricopeptide (TPR) repeat protein